MKKVLLTGSNGFVGTHLKNLLSGYQITCFDRNKDFDSQVHSQDIIIHSAALAHSPEINDWESYKKANVDLTISLSQAAKKNQVTKFIFISTIKVLGEKSSADLPVTENSPYKPQDAYSKSKTIAEEYLKENWQEGLTILRPVVIYGKGVKGNFKLLKKFTGMWLPLRGFSSKRSILFINHFADIIRKCIEADQSNKVFNCCEEKAYSIAELFVAIGKAVGKRSKVFYFPLSILKLALTLVGKAYILERLNSTYIVSNKHLKSKLNWQPRYSFEETMKLSFGE